MDLEWRPSFGVGVRPLPSLMQVALEGRVFLLDLLRLSQPPGGPGGRAFCQLVSRLLSDPSITKLGEPGLASPTRGCALRGRASSGCPVTMTTLPSGYALPGDLRSLSSLQPGLAHVHKLLQAGVDLEVVHQQVRMGGQDSPALRGGRCPGAPPY